MPGYVQAGLDAPSRIRGQLRRGELPLELAGYAVDDHVDVARLVTVGQLMVHANASSAMPDWNFGGTALRLASRSGDAREFARIERRLQITLEAMLDDGSLQRDVTYLGKLAALHRVGIDYVALLQDLRDWDEEGKPAQARWAVQFWGDGL